MSKPRVLAICVFQNGRRVLGARGEDKVTGEIFFRPFGGGVEFGERSADALRREIMEELGQSIDEVQLLDVIENVYEFDGKPGHEVVFVYNASFSDPKIYDLEIVQGIEETRRLELQGHWLDLGDIIAGRVRLYPVDIQSALRKLQYE